MGRTVFLYQLYLSSLSGVSSWFSTGAYCLNTDPSAKELTQAQAAGAIASPKGNMMVSSTEATRISTRRSVTGKCLINIIEAVGKDHFDGVIYLYSIIFFHLKTV